MFDRSGCFVFQDAFVDKFEMLVLHRIILQFQIMLMLALLELQYDVSLQTKMKTTSMLKNVTFV